MTESAFELFNAEAPPGPILFVCDHASNVLPKSYGTLGLEAGDFAAHIACDIGAATVTRRLAGEFGAPAILARWSRLLIDLNRGPDDPTLVMKLSDGRIIPGNRHAGADEIAHRLKEFYAPYHAAIEQHIASAWSAGYVPVIFSMHSFTPVWKGERRPWEVGVLWDRDDRVAKTMMAALADAGFVAGDNEPYDGELENDCMHLHGTMHGLPHVLIEMRQDLIATPSAAEAFAMRLKPVMERALSDMGKPTIQFTRPLPAKY